jgi:hypothetical protein
VHENGQLPNAFRNRPDISVASPYPFAFASNAMACRVVADNACQLANVVASSTSTVPEVCHASSTPLISLGIVVWFESCAAHLS